MARALGRGRSTVFILMAMACGGLAEGDGFYSGFHESLQLRDLSEEEAITLCEREVDYLFTKLTLENYCLWDATKAPSVTEEHYRQECHKRYEKCLPRVEERRAEEWTIRLSYCHGGEPMVIPGVSVRDCPISIAKSERCLIGYWANALSAALVPCEHVTLEDSERRTLVPEECSGFSACY